MRKDAVKEDYLWRVGTRLLRIPNAMVLEHPDEFMREVVEAIRASVQNARK
jgi:very-short-patch-repair endonuclease